MNALVLLLAVLSAFGLALAAYVFLSSRHQKSSRLPLNLVGRFGSVERALGPEGFVLVGGELWPARARGGMTVERGRMNVRVVGARGSVLEVEPVPGGSPEGGFRERRRSVSGSGSGVAREVLLGAVASTEAVEP